MPYTIESVLKWTAVNSCINVDLIQCGSFFQGLKVYFLFLSNIFEHFYTYLIINLSKISPMQAAPLLIKTSTEYFISIIMLIS